MKRRFLHLVAIITALLAVVPANANDAVYFTSGNQLIPVEETNIRVEKEVLTITLKDDDRAYIDVYYEFHNPNPDATTVTMGFEADQPYGDCTSFNANGVHPNIFNFTVEMNGNQLPFRNAICQKDLNEGFKPIDMKKWKVSDDFEHVLIPVNGKGGDESMPYSYVYYFTATFKPGINKVHHTYSYTCANGVGFLYAVNYKLSPAMRWAQGNIGDFTLRLSVPNTAKHFVIPRTDGFEGGEFRITSGQGKWRELNTQYQGFYEFSLRSATAEIRIKNFKVSKDEWGNYEELEIMSADHAYYSGMMDDEFKVGAVYDRNTARYLHMTQEMEEKNILPRDKKLRERIQRNLPYANRGHVFKDQQLKKYFESLWWYMPDSDYKDDTSDFTEYDWQYIKE